MKDMFMYSTNEYSHLTVANKFAGFVGYDKYMPSVRRDTRQYNYSKREHQANLKRLAFFIIRVVGTAATATGCKPVTIRTIGGSSPSPPICEGYGFTPHQGGGERKPKLKVVLVQTRIN